MRSNDQLTMGVGMQWFVLLAGIAAFLLIPISSSAQEIPCLNPRVDRTEFVRAGERRQGPANNAQPRACRSSDDLWPYYPSKWRSDGRRNDETYRSEYEFDQAGNF
mgnify:CR=1 FL=1